MLKILLVVGVIIMGLAIDLGGVPGQPRIGFQYWNNPGPFVDYIATGSWGKFLGFWAVMNNAAYASAFLSFFFQIVGSELIIHSERLGLESPKKFQ